MVDETLANYRWNYSIGFINSCQFLFYFRQVETECRLGQDHNSEVKKGPYKDQIPVNGVVLPLTSIYLDATEGGRVEEKYVEDGTVMKKGEPILRLSNTNLLMTMM